MAILVTGGLGYIGSHTVIELLRNDYQVIIVDNLYNSKIEVLDRIGKITGKRVLFFKGDVQNEDFLRNVFKNNQITDVIHFAGLKAVGESVEKPELYYWNNITTTLTLTKIMAEFNVYNLVFSSSATVYGDISRLPLKEDYFIGACTNPYGDSKYQQEMIFKTLHKWNDRWNVALLRYFNPIGADKSGLIGEDPNGIPNNLMPYITQVACGRRDHLNVFGNDYKTVDGTGVRDYIHVLDLASGHIAALKSLETIKGVNAYNLGTGKGTSVLELVHAFERVNNIKIPLVICPRRAGDLDENYADVTKAREILHWEAKYNIEDACRDSYNWQMKNPKGL